MLYDSYPSSSKRWLSGYVSENPKSAWSVGANKSNETTSARNWNTKWELAGMFRLYNGVCEMICRAVTLPHKVYKDILLNVESNIDE